MAVAERVELRSKPDEIVFGVAQAEERAIVTENVRDYRVLAAHHLARGAIHHGLVFTTNRTFPRHSPSPTGRLIIALDHLLSATPDGRNREFWLS